MRFAIPENKPVFPEKKSENGKAGEKKPAGLGDLRDKLESKEEIQPRSIRELAKENLGRVRNRPQDTISPSIGTSGKPATSGQTSKIDHQFFLKQSGFSSSKIQDKAGRL